MVPPEKRLPGTECTGRGELEPARGRGLGDGACPGVCAFCLGDRGELECTYYIAGCTGGPVTGETNMAREVYEQVLCDYPICGRNVPRRVRSVTLRAV